MDGLDKQFSLRMRQEEMDRLTHIVNTRKDCIGERKYDNRNHFIRAAIVQLIRKEQSEKELDDSYEKRWRSEGTWSK